MNKPTPWAEKPVRPLTDDQRDLAGRHWKVSRHLSRQLKAMYPAFADEFESAANLALVEAARDYDATRGCKFSTFAYRRIQGSLADVVRKSRSIPGVDARLLPFRPFPIRCGLILCYGVPPKVGTEHDSEDSFEARIKPLPEKHRHVVRRHYLYGETMAVIAASVGVSVSEVTRRHRMAIQLLTPAFDENGHPITGHRIKRPRTKSA
ncbi:MAG: sigma-70 family RNA polymerase sigma factor [Isosphaeraceae bacterium]